MYFLHTAGGVSQDKSVTLFKLTDNAAVVGLITDNESLCIASGGSAAERYSIQNNLLFHLNRSNDEKKTPGEK